MGGDADLVTPWRANPPGQPARRRSPGAGRWSSKAVRWPGHGLGRRPLQDRRHRHQETGEFSLLSISRCHTSSDSNVQMRGCSSRSPDEWSASSLATVALSNVVPTNEDGPVSKSNAISRKPPWNHLSRGTLKPTFGRSTIAAGSRRRATSLTTHFVVRPCTFTLLGSANASSTTR